MAQMSVLLPVDLQNWTDARVAEGHYESAGDYVRDLVRRDQNYEEKLRVLRAAIDEGLPSGESDATIESIITDRRKRDALT